jgi:hypothetical protein
MRATWVRSAIVVSLFVVGAIAAIAVQQYLKGRGADDELAREVRNDRLQWTGDIVGLAPITSAEFREAISSRGSRGVAPLLEMLDDPTRFAAAHVALTQIFEDEPPRDTRQWNGLHLLLKADGSVVYDQHDLGRLKQRWEEAAEAKTVNR